MKRLSPLEALAAGVVAGLAGALAQDLFFLVTGRIAPPPVDDGFQPPEREQKDEQSTETVARRFTEQLAQRGPLESLRLGGRVVHYGFGAAWGAVYGIVAASNGGGGTLASGFKFGVMVWSAADNVILPAFKLSAWPTHYPLHNHLYAVSAHLVYGGTVAVAFRAFPGARGTHLRRGLERGAHAVTHTVKRALLERILAAAIELPRPLLRRSTTLAARTMA